MDKDKKFLLYSIILTVLGILDSAYLTWIKYSHNETRCLPGLGDCGSVNLSAYSMLGNIPVALIGLAGYIFILGIFLLFLKNFINLHIFSYLLFAITFVGFLFSGYLTYVELGILHAVCGFCVLSAICMTILFALSLYKISKLLNN
jgi:uncharacterized membrane protein